MTLSLTIRISVKSRHCETEVTGLRRPCFPGEEVRLSVRRGSPFRISLLCCSHPGPLGSEQPSIMVEARRSRLVRLVVDVEFFEYSRF